MPPSHHMIVLNNTTIRVLSGSEVQDLKAAAYHPPNFSLSPFEKK